MTIKFDVKINTNAELMKDIQDLINKHKNNIENVMTQYTQSTDQILWQVIIQFKPVWMDVDKE